MAAAADAPALAEEDFTAGELEVAGILCNLGSIVLRPDATAPSPSPMGIPCWGRRLPRSSPARKPHPAVAAAVRRASPDTTLEFPGESGEEEAEAHMGGKRKKPRTQHDEWMQEQRGIVATLSRENAHLSKEIEEYRARLQSSRGTNKSLKQMQSMLDQRRREEEEQEERKSEAAAIRRPALGLDLNAPAPASGMDLDALEPVPRMDLDAPESKPAAVLEWYYVAQRRAAATGARERRRQIRLAKVASSQYGRRATATRAR